MMLLLPALFWFSASVTPPVRPTPPPLARVLALSQRQKAETSVILSSLKEQTRAIREDAHLTASEKKARIHALRRQARQEIESLLTAAQAAKLVSLRRRRISPPEPPPARR